MPTPSEAEVQSQWKAAVAVLEWIRANAETTSGHLAGLADTLTQALEGDFATEKAQAVEQIRARYASLYTPASVRAVIDPHLRDYARVRGFAETDPSAILGRLYQDFIDNSKTVTTRAITHGSPSAGGSNVGDGVLNRLVVDENNHEIEACNPEDKVFECVLDRNSGTNSHEEQFEIRGETPSKDGLETLGSGTLTSIIAASARHSAQFLTNPSFTTYSGTTSVPTAIDGWSVGTDIANFEIVTSSYYRDLDGESAPASLKIKGDDYVQQTFLTQKNPKFFPNVPYYCQIAWNREVGSLDNPATLTLSLGGTSANVSLTTQTGWNVLRLTLNQNLWFENFNTGTLTLKIELSNHDSGYLLVDDVILVPMTQIDGTWYTLVGGATPFLRRDTFTVADTGGAPGTGKIQHWLWRGYGRYLPHTSAGSATFTDPS